MIALFAAVLGSLLFVLSVKDEKEKKKWKSRTALGVWTGVTFAILHFNRSLIPGGMAFPPLGETASLAAFWGGLAGGWLGPTALVLVAGQLLGMFKHLFSPRDNQPKAVPT